MAHSTANKLSTFAAQNQQGDQDDCSYYDRAQRTYNNTHRRDRAVDLRGTVTDHKDPARYYHKLAVVICIPIGASIGLVLPSAWIL